MPLSGMWCHAILYIGTKVSGGHGVCGLADMYYSSPNTLVPIYETTRHIQKEDSNPGAVFWVLAINLMVVILLLSISTTKHFNFSV